jgi:hypothetical protein
MKLAKNKVKSKINSHISEAGTISWVKNALAVVTTTEGGGKLLE